MKALKLKEYTLNSNNKQLLNMIESSRQIMVNEFGLNINIIIKNSMKNLNGYIEFIKRNQETRIVEKFGDIYIKTSGGNDNEKVIETIAHEFAHIRYSNCHNTLKKDMKYDKLKEDRLHKEYTKELKQKIIKELQESGIVQ